MIASAARAFRNIGTKVDNVVDISDSLLVMIKAAAANPTVMKKLVKDSPEAFIPIFKVMDDVDLKAIYKSMDADGKAKLAKAFDDTGNLALLRRMVPDSSVLKTALAVGAGAGLLAWLDDKFEDSEEEFKNCMAGCLPHNWDAYDQDTIEAADLEYSTPETLEQYQITPIDNQPYCVSPNQECEEFCKPKCEELSEVDIPFWDSPVNPFNPDSPFNPLKWLERLLPDLDLSFLDPTIIAGASSACSSLVLLLVIMMTMV
jgi:hypothetical protein